jgi:Zn-dependent protease with chaperone function
MIVTITGAALIRWRSLSSRGGAVAEALGGQLVSPETIDLLERRFINVTEEMAIAANTPAPDLYILPEEDGINAFASGPTPEQSAIAVTRGALERLSRDELQGVVAHEFSHILHGDVRLNIRLASYIFGLTFISEIGARVLRAASEGSSPRPIDNEVWGVGSFKIRNSSRYGHGRDNKSPVAFLILITGLFFTLFGLLGNLVSVLLNAAISREREYLADATAVQLTRNPEGISGALKKIGGYSKGAEISASAARGLSHFFLASSHVPRFFEKLYASHPPLLERIHRIDPSFEGVLPDDSQIEQQTGEEND